MGALQEKVQSVAQEGARRGAHAVAGVVRDHLYDLNSRRHRPGGPITPQFYADAAKSVSVTDSTVSITKLGLAQRWLGGTIRAGSGTSSATGLATKYLAIPARAEAYGHPPSDFHDLLFVPRKNGGAMLIQALQTLVAWGKTGPRSRGERGGLVMYWLKTEVTQAPDPTVMPTEEEMISAAAEAINDYLNNLSK